VDGVGDVVFHGVGVPVGDHQADVVVIDDDRARGGEDLADLDVIERLSPISLLTFIGTADATIARNGISGSFTGTFAFVIGQGITGVILQNPCFGMHQFTLTPLARSMT
jgi:hypothetical protein